LFCYCEGVIYFDAEISNRAFDLGMSEQKLDGPEIASAPIDQGSFCASQRMRAEESRVQPDAADPLRHETCILADGHAGVRTATTGEQELAEIVSSLPPAQRSTYLERLGRLRSRGRNVGWVVEEEFNSLWYDTVDEQQCE
jgi:hypothetical protein